MIIRPPSCGAVGLPAAALRSQARSAGVKCRAVSRRLYLPALVFVSFALLGGHPVAQQVPVFRGGIDLVNLGVTVTDRKGQLVADLTADDLEIVEDGKKQEIRLFATGDRSSAQGPELHLGLLLDVSESMGEDVKFTRTAAIKFLNTLTDAVDVTVVDFDTEVRVARYGQNDFARLIERIRQQRTTGMTALYDAIGVYLDGAGGQTGRKIMLLYSDGGDTRSSMRLNELLDLLKASDATVYVIGELDHQSSFARDQARTILMSIAEATGGQAFFPSSVKELDQMYEKVLAEIRAQYTIGYISTNDKTDGAWRKVEIRIVSKTRRDLRVRSRKGYYGPYKAEK
jgi:Ca-activated chloride channel homolog